MITKIRNINFQKSLRLTLAGLFAFSLVLSTPSLFAEESNGVQPGYEQDGKITICHRTKSTVRPYTVNSISINAADGSLGQGKKDHTAHTGGVFDPNTTYTPPMSGDQWGDIIPPYYWGNGNYFEGYNWPDGQSIWENDCKIADQPNTVEVSLEKQWYTADGTLIVPDENFETEPWNIYLLVDEERLATIPFYPGVVDDFGEDFSSAIMVEDGNYDVTETTVKGWVEADCSELSATGYVNTGTGTDFTASENGVHLVCNQEIPADDEDEENGRDVLGDNDKKPEGVVLSEAAQVVAPVGAVDAGAGSAASSLATSLYGLVASVATLGYGAARFRKSE
jgi:hypothetical protein